MGKKKEPVVYHYVPTDHVVTVQEGADTRYADQHPERFVRIADVAAWVQQRVENGEGLPPGLPAGLVWNGLDPAVLGE